VPRTESVDKEARRWIIALLKKEMEDRGLSQADVARKMDVSEGTISNLIKDPVKGLGLDIAIKIHRALGIHGSEMLGPPDWKRIPPLRAAPVAPPERRTGAGVKASSAKAQR
jgi:transcriptional regulator with XRE-family HTH domain